MEIELAEKQPGGGAGRALAAPWRRGQWARRIAYRLARSVAGRLALMSFVAQKALVSRKPIRLHLDIPTVGSLWRGYIMVGGWAYSQAGAITTIEVFLAGRPLGRLAYGRPRPDLRAAHPALTTDDCGFHQAVIAPPDLVGPQSLRLRVADTQGNHSELTLRIELATVNPVQINLDTPAPRTAWRGCLVIGGWSYSLADPVERVEVWMGDQMLRSLPYGYPRPDVRASQPALTTDACGFHEIVTLPGELTGPHQLRVRAIDARGNQAEVTAEIEVVAPDDVDPQRGRFAMPAFPDGHFYSPVVNIAETVASEARLWTATPECRSLDLNLAEQERFLHEDFRRHAGAYDYPARLDDRRSEHDFYTGNSQFSWLDARVLFVMLLARRPRRMIEIGSGYSSLLVADVNRRFLDGQLAFTCVEPYPRPFLVAGVPGITSLIPARVQDVGLELFETLDENDILFIDSSHVSKTGSDVNHIIFEILPRLRRGVLIHIHDIFLPHEYPKNWVIEDQISWNEQYLIRALLMGTTTYRVLFGARCAEQTFPALLRELLGGEPFGGSSLWLQKVE